MYHGEGVIVTLNNGVGKKAYGEEIESKIESKDLIYLVNELRLAGAEAISINEERIINMSDIVDISDKYILVNSQRIEAPYIVKAIGDKTYLQSALSIKNGYIDQKTAKGMSVTVEIKNDIKILKYNGNMTLKYMK